MPHGVHVPNGGSAPASVPGWFARAGARAGDRPALQDRAGQVTMRALLDEAAALAGGLEAMGVKRGEPVGFYADNSRRWIAADLAIQSAGAVSVPRGTDTPAEEMMDLFRHAEVRVVLAHGVRAAAALEAQRSRHPGLREVVCLDPEGAPGRTSVDLQREGAGRASFAERAARVGADDLATIIYTSGTTGRPKGVMLSQANFDHQLRVLPEALEIGDDEVFLSLLPPWHIFERIVEYVALTNGCRLVYTDQRRFRDDLAAVEPTFVPSVPRIWEMVHQRVLKTLEDGGALRRGVFRAGLAVARARTWGWDRARGHVIAWDEVGGLGMPVEGVKRFGALLVAALAWLPDRLAHAVVFRRLRKLVGGRLKGAISGGGLMPAHVDRFFRAIELPVLIGYGLTETSPVLTLRRQHRNVIGSIGTAVREVEIQIRDVETGAPLPAGRTGVVVTRGPQVMRGYFKDPELTARAIDAQGWFDTGDLGALTPQGDLCFRGRLKETIVLSGGENVEPGRVEEALLPSSLIEQVVVVGQDRKNLAALVLPRADDLAKALGWPAPLAPAEAARRPEVLRALQAEVVRRTSSLMPFEQVSRVALLPEPLDVAGGCLTATLKLRRHVIVERYKALIEDAYRP
jgi:long-chain acyl-CoA synthetase